MNIHQTNRLYRYIENANVEQKARLLESRVAENAETIENLRHERSLLTADYKALHQRYSAVSEVSFTDSLGRN